QALDQGRTLWDKPADDTIRLLHIAHLDPVGRTDSGEIGTFQVLADDPLQVSCRRGLKIRLAGADDALAEEDPLARANDGLQLFEPGGERLVKKGFAVSVKRVEGDVNRRRGAACGMDRTGAFLRVAGAHEVEIRRAVVSQDDDFAVEDG